LVEQDLVHRVDAAGNEDGGIDAGLLAQLGRILGHGDGVQIDQAEDALIFALQGYPILDRAKIIAEMGDAGGLDAREDACHAGLVTLSLGGWSTTAVAGRRGCEKVIKPYSGRL
jgi:hypothetical protein